MPIIFDYSERLAFGFGFNSVFRGLIEDQYAWVFQDGAGDGGALFFAAGDLQAAFAGYDVIAVQA